MWVWKLSIPEKMRFFVWLVCHNSLPTNKRRMRRHLSHDAACACCNAPLMEDTIVDCVGNTPTPALKLLLIADAAGMAYIIRPCFLCCYNSFLFSPVPKTEKLHITLYAENVIVYISVIETICISFRAAYATHLVIFGA